MGGMKREGTKRELETERGKRRKNTPVQQICLMEQKSSEKSDFYKYVNFSALLVVALQGLYVELN